MILLNDDRRIISPENSKFIIKFPIEMNDFSLIITSGSFAFSWRSELQFDALS